MLLTDLAESCMDVPWEMDCGEGPGGVGTELPLGLDIPFSAAVCLVLLGGLR